jgi:alpha-galactosidase
MCGIATNASAQNSGTLQQAAPTSTTVPLESLDLSVMQQDFGTPQVDKSVSGNPLTLGGVVHAHGVGTHAYSCVIVDLHGDATRFTSTVGIDDEVGTQGAVTFQVVVDGKPVETSAVLQGGSAPQQISVDLTGAKRMVLLVNAATESNHFDHADWADAQIDLVPNAPTPPNTTVIVLWPPRIAYLPADPNPAIHGPRIVGATPGRPFLFLIPATGVGPLAYGATGLPGGLTLDHGTGIISGAIDTAGTTTVHLFVRGTGKSAERDLVIVGGDHKLALTPPMGWNSWNVWGGKVTEDEVKAAADEFITTGLANHGFQYINIDDTWEGVRDSSGNIHSNPKFPDMAGLTAYIHSKGLKAGLYSSPGPLTCAGYTASYQHEDQDAATYAGWGFDYLKYDWCSYDHIAKDHSLAELQKPYSVMRASLDKVTRDIVFSFCQYGMGDVWTWGQQVGGNCWRTHGDIFDTWSSLHDIIEKENGHQIYSRPGAWNDPDMLMVGIVGFGNTHPSRLTPNEQILHISMWCMFSAPLLIGCDLTRIDPFTLALLSNDEALDIDQDPLAKPAGRISQVPGGGEIWARPLSDGSTAVALVNMAPVSQIITADWSSLGLKGSKSVHDVWLHTTSVVTDGKYTVEVPPHGVVLVKIDALPRTL